MLTFCANCILHCIGQGAGADGDTYGSLTLLQSDEIVGYSLNLAFGNNDADKSHWIEYVFANKADIATSNHTRNTAKSCSGILVKSVNRGSSRMLWMEECKSSLRYEIFQSFEGFSVSKLIFSRGDSFSSDSCDFRLYNSRNVEVYECIFYQNKQNNDFLFYDIDSITFSGCKFSRSSVVIGGDETKVNAKFSGNVLSLQEIPNLDIYVPAKCSARKTIASNCYLKNVIQISLVINTNCCV